MIKVSIIIPVYNTEKYLYKCLESVVNQSIDDYEVIIINDGSTDNSIDIISKFKEKYPDMITVLNQENCGQAVARNRGISVATGEYIGFVDSDDCISCNMYAEMYRQIVLDDSDYIDCNYKYIEVLRDGTERQKKIYGTIKKYNDCREMFIDPLVSPWNKLYRTSIIKENGITFPEHVIYEDTSFYIKSIPYLKKTSHIEETFVSHYYRSNSTMNASSKSRVDNIFIVIDDIIDWYESKELFYKYREELEFFCTKILLGSSFKRIAHIHDDSYSKQLTQKTVQYLEAKFPKYKKNKYIKRNMYSLYLKSINRKTLDIYRRLLSFR